MPSKELVRPPVCWAMTGRGEAPRERRNCRAVGGIEKYCCPTKIKIGVNWAFSVIWITNTIALLGLKWEDVQICKIG